MKRNQVFGIAAVLAAGLILYLGFHGGFTDPVLRQREMATRLLGEYLAIQRPGSHALAVGNPFTLEADRPEEIYTFEAAGIRGLRAGFQDRIVLEEVVYPELRHTYLENPNSVYIAPDTRTPLSFLVAESSFDDLAARHPECDLIVSLIGLPVSTRELEVWRNPEGPSFALLLPDLRVVGDREAVEAAFGRGKILAAMVDRPGDTTSGAGEGAALSKAGFLLITPENVASVLRDNPEVLGFRGSQ